MTFTISDSNLGNFSDAAVFVHPGRCRLELDWTPTIANPALPTASDAYAPGRARLPLHVQRHDLELGRECRSICRINSENGNDTTGESGYSSPPLEQHVLQDHDRGRDLAPEFDGKNSNSQSTTALAMNDIFDELRIFAVGLDRQGRRRSVATVQPVLQQHQLDDHAQTWGPRTRRPRQPTSRPPPAPSSAIPSSSIAAAGNFELQPTSPAIERPAARSGRSPRPMRSTPP